MSTLLKKNEKDAIRVKNNTNNDYYSYIIRDKIIKNRYKILIDTDSLVIQTLIEDVIFKIKINKLYNANEVQNTLHQYLKEKGYWLFNDWYKINSDDEVFYIAKSIVSISK